MHSVTHLSFNAGDVFWATSLKSTDYLFAVDSMCFSLTFNPLECRGNYSATSNDMKSVHWPLAGGLLRLVQRGGDWAALHPAQAAPRSLYQPTHQQHCSAPIIVLLYK